MSQIILERLRPDHLATFMPQPVQAAAPSLMTPEFIGELLRQKGVAWAGVADGRTLGCAGLVEATPGRAIGWALFSQEVLGRFKGVHRLVLSVIADSPWRRVEVYVDVNHESGARWAERLGFEREGRMRSFTPDGRDCFLYARVK